MVDVVQTQPLDVDDFSGGITDYYVGCPLNRYQLADNLLLVKYANAARLFTRPGSEIYDATNYQLPSGAQRVGTIKNFKNTPLFHSARNFYYVNAGSWATLTGPTGNAVFPTGNTVNNYLSMSEWNNHLFGTNDNYTRPFKIYRDGSNALQLRTAGLPKLATSPTITPTAGANNYIYRFTRRYSYTVGTVEFVDESSYVEVLVTSSADPGISPSAITAIEVLANGSDYNYDTASPNLTVRIYRTVNNGTALFLVGSVPNGTTVFNDNVSDTALANNQSMYTEGGVVQNDAPPLANLIHINQNRGYYADVKEGTEIRKNRLYQSIDGDIDSVPARFFVDVDDDIIGISSVKDTVILACTSSTWRVDGVFDTKGRGGMTAQKISDTSSCVSGQSMVQTLDGCFWCGKDSFYFSDGFKVLKLNRGWDQTHAALTDVTSKAEARKRIQGKYDPRTRRIYWSVWASATNPDNDKVYVLDLNWPHFLDGVSDGAFTSWSGGVNFAPTALEFINDNLVRGDRRGYNFRHRANIYTDPKIDTLTNPSTWSVATIFYDYRGAAFNFGTNFRRKFVPRISVTCENETNVSLQIVSNSDKNRIISNCKPIRFRANLTWGEPDVYWGDPELIWNYDGLIDQQRRMPANALRKSYQQIYLQNAFVAILSSDLIGGVTVDSFLKTATLVNTGQYDWPTNSVDYYIAFSNDNYVREYLVTGRTNDVLTFVDVQGMAPNGAQEWVLRGYPKGEIMNLVGYTLQYAVFGETQTQFTLEGTGEVGSND